MIEGTWEFNDPTNDEPKTFVCPDCNGMGIIVDYCDPDENEGRWFNFEACETCNGTGEVEAEGEDFFTLAKRQSEQ